MVKYADGQVIVPNALLRINWSKVEDENGYHFEEAFDQCFINAYKNRQKVCLGVFPLDSWRYNTLKVNGMTGS